MKKWSVESFSMALDEKWFRVRKDIVNLPGGKRLDDYFVWQEGNVAEVVAITPQNKQNKLVLVRQYKHGAGDIMVEIPAGYMNKSETPLQAAKRELREETGYTGGSWEPLGVVSIHPTKSDGRHYLYLATGVEKTADTKWDGNEEIEVLLKSFREAVKMVENGEIWVASSISALFLAQRKLGWK